MDRTLEDLTYQFAHLEVIKALPNELRHREFVVNRAFDVRSSSMAYLALTISHDATPLGVSGSPNAYTLANQLVGRVLRTFFLGDTEITDAETYFKTCVQNFRRALNDMVSIPLTIEVWELVKGTNMF